MKPLDVAFEFADEFYRQRRRGAGVLPNSHHNNIVRLGGFFAGLLRALYICPGCDDGTVMHPSKDGCMAKCPQCGGVCDTSAIWRKEAADNGGV